MHDKETSSIERVPSQGLGYRYAGSLAFFFWGAAVCNIKKSLSFNQIHQSTNKDQIRFTCKEAFILVTRLHCPPVVCIITVEFALTARSLHDRACSHINPPRWLSCPSEDMSSPRKSGQVLNQPLSRQTELCLMLPPQHVAQEPTSGARSREAKHLGHNGLTDAYASACQVSDTVR